MLIHSASSGSRQTGFLPDDTSTRVALIAFLAMQVGVCPRTLDAFALLGGFVRSLPIALGIPPQSGEGVRDSGWRLGRRDGFTEVVRGHLKYSLSVPLL
jgi:hypothetical protein